jgi:hypothetical protein
VTSAIFASSRSGRARARFGGLRVRFEAIYDGVPHGARGRRLRYETGDVISALQLRFRKSKQASDLVIHPVPCCPVRPARLAEGVWIL